MLFNSYEFLFLFLPITYVVFLLCRKFFAGDAAMLVWLTSASLFFYGWWNPTYLLLITVSVGLNFLAGRLLIAPDILAKPKLRRAIVSLGILSNLAAIGWFKYANFLVDTSNSALNTQIDLPPILLPLAISFFTFQQIAYLADVYRDHESGEKQLSRYAFFVCFFPQLIAGPIVHHGEIMPQLRGSALKNYTATYLIEGLSWFMVGLFKKVALADSFAVLATPVFTAATGDLPISFIDAWFGALAYTLQLYFDFSGYSDMAIGLAMMFGLRLPLNFNSPYKALNIADFWRRWHMTLSRFLQDYLYIPLGGNRLGNTRRYTNLMTTMLIGGLWHGAGWTFVFWGGLHGLYLVVQAGWSALRARLGFQQASLLYRSFAGGLTFLAVVVAWVFFRADTFSGALNILKGMAGLQGVIVPETYMVRLYNLGLGNYIESLGWVSGDLNFTEWSFRKSLVLLASGLAIVWLLPNTQEIFRQVQLFRTTDSKSSWWNWQANYGWACALGIVAALSIAFVANESEFLYFRF